MKSHRSGTWRKSAWAATGLSTLLAATSVNAQPPRGERGPGGNGGGGSVEAAVNRLMAFDSNGDGKLAKEEVTDARLQPLLQRADANQDGIVSKDELSTLLTKEAASIRTPGRGPGGPSGPPPEGVAGGQPGPGPGGAGGRGPGGPGGPGGPQPGQVLPPFLQEQLNLTEAQRRELQDLQKDVDTRLGKILTPEQLQQLREMSRRGPGGGGPGGPGRPPGGGAANGGGRPNRPPQ